MPFPVIEFNAERLPHATDDLDRDRSAVIGPLAVPGVMEALVEFLVLRLPEQRPRCDLRPIHIGATEADKRQATAGRLEAMHETALLAFGGFALVKDHTVAGLQRPFEAHRHTVARDVDHRAKQGTALLTKAGVHEALVIDAPQPTRMEATRESHLHRVVLFAADLLGGLIGVTAFLQGIPGGIDRPTVSLGDRGDVLRRLEPTFNLQGLHPGTD